MLPTPRFSRGIGLVLHLFRGRGELQLRVAVFGASFYAHAAIFTKNCFFSFTSCTCYKFKIRHSLRLIINTVNYPIQSRVMFLND